MFINILEGRGTFKILPKVLFKHRIHGKNITANKDKFEHGYHQLSNKWGEVVLGKYEFNLENLYKFYGYYFQYNPEKVK